MKTTIAIIALSVNTIDSIGYDIGSSYGETMEILI